MSRKKGQKNEKKFYAIGSLIAVIGPTMAVISCDESSSSTGSDGTAKAKESKIVKTDEIKKAQIYPEQKTVYVEYEDTTKQLGTTQTLEADVVTAIAKFAESIPTSEVFDTLMVKIKGPIDGSDASHQKEYTLEIFEPNYPDLNSKPAAAYETLIQSAWSSKVEFDETDKTEVDPTAFANINITNWGSTIGLAVNSVINSWDTKHLMAWKGGMSKNLGSNVNALGSSSNLNDIATGDITEPVKKLFIANTNVLTEDHQSTLLTIVWYFANSSTGISDLDNDKAQKIHKAFVDAWNESFTREPNDLDPDTLLKGLKAVSTELESFITNNTPFVKKDL